jgi:RNA polymerase sigma-70 factor (ECF subfamily)
MGQAPQPEGARHDDQATTLGDLLFAKGAKPPVSESDWAALVQAVAEGDQRAMHALYRGMHRIVFTYIMKITHNRETAEELTVDVFYDVWRRAPAYSPAGGSVVGWIMNQARSRAIDRLRFEQRKKRAANPTNDGLTESGEGDGPHEVMSAKEQSCLVRHALDCLAPQERQAIEAAFFSELTYSEVASRLNQPVGTVKTRIRSGLAKLRRALAGTAHLPL